MPSQTRKDDNLIPKDRPEPAKRQRGQKPDIPSPNNMPPWDLLVIDNDLEHGKPNLPASVDRASPFDLFNLFFTY